MHRTSQAPAANVGLATTSQHSRKLWTSIVIAACALIIAFAGPSTAQTFRGTILGTVTDPNGAVVPEAIVTARNVGTGIERSTASDEFRELHYCQTAHRAYQVTVQKSGFQTLAVNEVIVEVAGERGDQTPLFCGRNFRPGNHTCSTGETTANTLNGPINTKAVADLRATIATFKNLADGPGSLRDQAAWN